MINIIGIDVSYGLLFVKCLKMTTVDKMKSISIQYLNTVDIDIKIQQDSNTVYYDFVNIVDNITK